MRDDIGQALSCTSFRASRTFSVPASTAEGCIEYQDVSPKQQERELVAAVGLPKEPVPFQSVCRIPVVT